MPAPSERKEETRLKIFTALRDRSLSFNELAEKTKISRRILAARLREMEEKKEVFVSFERAKKGPPKVKYTLVDENYLKKMEPLVKHMKFITAIEELVNQIVDVIMTLARVGRLDPDSAAEKIVDLVIKSSIILLRAELVREPYAEPDWDRFVRGEVIGVLKRVFNRLIGVPIDEKIRREVNESLNEDYKRLKEILEEMEQMAKEYVETRFKEQESTTP